MVGRPGLRPGSHRDPGGPGPAGRLHFDVLDGQRGVAALMVLLGHASAMMLAPAHTLVPRKGLAVVFFFMLSGFVVASAYRDRIRRGMTLRAFMLRRVIRLYPLIVLGVAIGTVWFAVFGERFWRGDLRLIAPALNLFALPAPLRPPFSTDRFPVDPPEWSLFFEMLAYLSFPVIVSRCSVRSLAVVTSLCGIVFAVSDWRFDAIPFGLLPFESEASFCGGLLLWHLFERDKLPSWQVPSWVLAAAIVAVCLCPLSLTVLVDYAALLIVFPAVIALGAARGRAAATRTERLLGDLSYPVYILHWPLLVAAHRFVRPHLGAEAAVAGGMVAAVAFAWAALRFYDAPVRAWLARSLLAERQQAAPASG